jgi:hypothetical protein
MAYRPADPLSPSLAAPAGTLPVMDPLGCVEFVSGPGEEVPQSDQVQSRLPDCPGPLHSEVPLTGGFAAHPGIRTTRRRNACIS